MKTSLRKLRGFASFRKSADLKEKNHGIPARHDEFLQASQDMLEMRSCYDSMLSAAAATANSAYEFSEALKEMGTCLLEKTSLNQDEVRSRVLLILGKAQFELQKLVDSYRVHIIQTITTPSESLLKELKTVEEMKRQCDDKRDLHKFMLAAQREKGRTRLAKGETFSSQQLQAAQDDYEEEANLFVFRLKSLKQGQSHSLLTQAVRHHAAQLNFFRKGVKSLAMVEPHVKAIAEQQHIDYDFIGLEDADKYDEENGYSYYGNDDGKLSFDYGYNEHIQNVFSMNRKSMEVMSEKSHGDLLSSARGPMTSSQSAPIIPEQKFELSERIKQIHSLSPLKFHTYVLPKPVDARNSLFAARPNNSGQPPKHLWYSSPLEPIESAKDSKYEVSNPMKLHVSHSNPKQNDSNSSPIKLHSPSAEGLSLLQSSSSFGSFGSRKFKRQAFSGPLIGKSSPANPTLYANDTFRSEYPPEPSLTPRHASSPQLTSASPFPLLSPIINELHELPQPPISSANPARPSTSVGHSGRLVPRSWRLYDGMLSNTASPLPTPPPVISRSFSIPSSSRRIGDLTMANFLEATQTAEVFEEISTATHTDVIFK